MVWDRYGDRENLYGWEIDHIAPQSLLRSKGITDQTLIDDVVNLRAMQCKNNLGKGDDYPSYMSFVTAKGNENVMKTLSLAVNLNKRKLLDDFYKMELCSQG